MSRFDYILHYLGTVNLSYEYNIEWSHMTCKSLTYDIVIALWSNVFDCRR